MDSLAERLRERARQLGISNAEAARRVGLEERRDAHYVCGRRTPDLATLRTICLGLGTTPNWLLGVADRLEKQPIRSALLERFAATASEMTLQELEIFVVQAEAVASMRK